MATIKIGNAMQSYEWFEDPFDQGSLKLVTKNPGEAIYEDANGAQIVLTGTGFSYNGSRITGGTITGVDFLDSDGGKLISLTDGKFDADAATDPLENDVSLYGFMSNLTAGDDKIVGGSKGDNLNLGENHGDDTVIAGPGGSFVGGSEGNDVMKGSTGWDTLSYEETRWMSDDKQGIVLDAAKGTVIDAWGDKDKISNFEEFRGSVYDDRMTGSKADEAFNGLKGGDTIDGGGGSDELRYQNDVRNGGKHGIVVNLEKGWVTDGFGDKDQVKSIERVIGTAENDKFTGGKGDEEFRGLDGKDSYHGGKGIDDVAFQFWENLPHQHGIQVDLTKGSNQIVDDGFGNQETTESIEAISGSQFDDKIKLGRDGWAWGDNGDDRITDGIGTQWLGGGAGQDTFIFASVKNMNVDKDLDYIDDFSQGDGDRLDLSAINGLSFEGTGKFEGGKEVRYAFDGDSTIVSGDVDGDKKTDFQIELNGKINLTVDDFIL
jgi:hypothetical protein